jgi:hypothetical protein
VGYNAVLSMGKSTDVSEEHVAFNFRDEEKFRWLPAAAARV